MFLNICAFEQEAETGRESRRACEGRAVSCVKDFFRWQDGLRAHGPVSASSPDALAAALGSRLQGKHLHGVCALFVFV